MDTVDVRQAQMNPNTRSAADTLAYTSWRLIILYLRIQMLTESSRLRMH